MVEGQMYHVNKGQTDFYFIFVYKTNLKMVERCLLNSRSCVLDN